MTGMPFVQGGVVAARGGDRVRRAVLFHTVLFLTACALVISRRPDAILRAQFFAEDGHVWFADAFNRGWFPPLLRSQDGYFQTVPRLAAALALLVPLAAAPLAMNAVALSIQVLPVNVLLSRRLSGWGSQPFRAGLAFLYLALPNSQEMSVSVTEAQWFIALTACLLVLASVPDSAAGRVFDVAAFVLCGLTGPFCLLLLPVALAYSWLRREKWRWVPVAIFAATALVQLSALLITDAAARNQGGPLGASWQMFVRILAGQVYLGAMLGGNPYSVQAAPLVAALVALGGTALIVRVCISSTVEFRLFLFFTALVFAGSLHSPMTGPPHGTSRWMILAETPGIRYWFFPMLAFAWSVLSFAAMRNGSRTRRLASAVLLLAMSFGVLTDWPIAPFPDLNFSSYAHSMESAATGTEVVIPLNPEGWTLSLKKR